MTKKGSQTPDPKKVAADSKLDAAKPGFPGLSGNGTLCKDHSTSKDPQDLEVDLAARQTEHCLEAWNFLSHSAWALANNQANQSIHMAYYAELRAADSLLAATGIAVKNTKSYYLDHNNVQKKINIRTHPFIRGIWPEWCQRPDAEDIFNQLKVTPSVTLRDISDSLHLRSNNRNSLLAWAFELTNISNDHEARNIASYDIKYSIEGISPADQNNNLKNLHMAWEHLVPGGLHGQIRFEVLYAEYLIWRYCLSFAADASENGENIEFERQLDNVLKRISRSTGESLEHLKRIFSLTQDENPLFEAFDLAAEPKTEAPNIFFRALILSRLATAKLNENIDTTGCVNALNWIENWLRQSGLIDAEQELSDIALDSDNYCFDAELIAEKKHHEAWINNAAELARCCRFNTALCWGFNF